MFPKDVTVSDDDLAWRFMQLNVLRSFPDDTTRSKLIPLTSYDIAQKLRPWTNDATVAQSDGTENHRQWANLNTRRELSRRVDHSRGMDSR
jgi:hypothetical protein